MTTIARVEAWPVNVPLVATYLMAPGVYPGMSRTVVRVTTTDGVVGLGETPAPGDAAIVLDLAPSLCGRDADDLRAELGRRPLPSAAARRDAKVLAANAGAGIEIALWDIAARLSRAAALVPARSAARTEIPFTEYFAYRIGREDTPADVADVLRADGRRARLTVVRRQGGSTPVEQDVRLVAAVREAIGPERTLRLDANMGWRLDTARGRPGARPAAFDVANVEEPVASFAELAELRRSSTIPFSAHAPTSPARPPSESRKHSCSAWRRAAASKGHDASSPRVSTQVSASGSTAATSASPRRRSST